MNTVFNLSGNDNRMFAIEAIASPHQAMQRSIEIKKTLIDRGYYCHIPRAPKELR